MSNEGAGLMQAPVRGERIVGKITSEGAGPTVIVMAAIHGNEPAGLRAAERVLERLQAERPAVRGTLVVLAGNLVALRENTRFVDKDLNRIWTAQQFAYMRVLSDDDGVVEDDQQRELLNALCGLMAEVRGEVFFLDLHTSSADGPPFVTVGDTLRNRRLARCFALPLILGLEEQVDGALLEHMNNIGVVTMGVEGGRHDSPDAVDHHEAVLWRALEATGFLRPGALAEQRRARERLALAGRGKPRVVEVRHRHAIDHDDHFAMGEGFSNFQPVRKGQTLARDKHGPVLAPQDGLVLLPLYQGKGNDGFFLAREVQMVWLRLSYVVRHLRLGGLLRFLPGVRQHGAGHDELEVDTRIARIYPLEFFHLFGYRKLRRKGERLIVGRRNHDLKPPKEIGDLRLDIGRQR
jgi:succinylglutamate desuccinylase